MTMQHLDTVIAFAFVMLGASLVIVAGTQVAGNVQAATSTVGAQDFPPISPPPVGAQRVFVRSDYTVTP